MKFCVVGTGRCGTNLLQRLLNHHPDLFVFNETHWIPKMFEFFGTGAADVDTLLSIVKRTNHVTDLPVLEFDADEFLDGLEGGTRLTVAEFCNRLGSFMANREGKSVWADKTPDYGPYLNVLQTIWPECKFIHLIRHGAEVSLSMSAHPGFRWMAVSKEQWWVNPSFNKYYQAHAVSERPIIEFIELWYNRLQRIRNEALRVPADNYLELRFEQLINNTDETLMQLAHFVDLDISDSWISEASALVDPGKIKCKASNIARNEFLEHHITLLNSLGYE